MKKPIARQGKKYKYKNSKNSNNSSGNNNKKKNKNNKLHCFKGANFRKEYVFFEILRVPHVKFV